MFQTHNDYRVFYQNMAYKDHLSLCKSLKLNLPIHLAVDDLVLLLVVRKKHLPLNQVVPIVVLNHNQLHAFDCNGKNNNLL